MHLIERAGPTKQVELRMEDVEAEVKLGKVGIRRDSSQWGETFIVIREKAAVLSLTERKKSNREHESVCEKPRDYGDFRRFNQLSNPVGPDLGLWLIR